MHVSDDDLALLALGEPVADTEDHLRTCPTCGAELRALSATVRTARRADLAHLPAPPASVWDRIAAELALADPPPVFVPAQESTARRTPWRRGLLAGGAGLTAAAAAAVVVLVLAGGDEVGSSAPAREAATLTALGPVDASGRVVLAALPDQRVLEVDTSGLPPADGSYEVWLVDLDQDRLLALGVLDDSGQGRLPVPDEVDLADYPEVDVSLEPDDGDPGHSGDSVLRGALPA